MQLSLRVVVVDYIMVSRPSSSRDRGAQCVNLTPGTTRDAALWSVLLRTRLGHSPSSRQILGDSDQGSLHSLNLSPWIHSISTDLRSAEQPATASSTFNRPPPQNRRGLRSTSTSTRPRHDCRAIAEHTSMFAPSP